MDFSTLEAFIEVAERQSFSKTAKALNLTQPAVSKRVAALESRLSTRLFDRIGRKVHLTEAGKLLLPSAVQIRFEVSRIEEVICNIGKAVNGKLTIGTNAYIAANQLSPIIKEFKDLFDEVDIDLHVSSTEESLDNVASGTFELALCPLHHSSVNNLSAKVSHTAIWNSDLKIAVAKSSPLASNTVTNIRDLTQATAILPPAKTLARKAINAKLDALNCEANVAVEASDFCTMRSLAAAGLGWTLLPDSVIDDSLAEVIVEGLHFPHSLSLIRRRDMTLSRAAESFIGILPMNAMA